MIYIPKFFDLKELIPREIYENTPKERRHLLWYVFDSRLLVTQDRIRERYGRTFVNNWHAGGELQYRGWRPPSCSIGADWSQHRFGRGSDSNSELATAEEIRADILSGKYPDIFEYITCIEMDASWLHFDVRNWDTVNGVLKIYPG